MSERRVWIGVFGGGFLVAAGLGGLIYMQSQKIEEARTVVAGMHTEIATSRKLIEGTSALEREVIVLREVSETIKGILPDDEAITNLVRTFQSFAGESEVDITGLKKKQNGLAQNVGFTRVAYTLSLAADAFQYLDFLDRLEGHERFMRIPTIKLVAARRNQMDSDGLPAHRVQMDVETFVYEPAQDSQPVKVEGYERKRDLLMGEINRRREALTFATYSYRGARGRRDPWIDPRVPVDGGGATALTVQEQMDRVQELYDETQKVLAMWSEIQNAQNVIEEMMNRARLEEVLSTLEAEVRRVRGQGAITYVPSQRRLTNDVAEVLAGLREELVKSDRGRGPSADQLGEVKKAMEAHMQEGEYELMLEAFSAVDDRLTLAETDPLRKPYVDHLRNLARIASTVQEFDRFDLSIQGTAIMRGSSPVVLINGRSYGLGDLLFDELVIHGITPDAVEFLFRGVILERRF